MLCREDNGMIYDLIFLRGMTPLRPMTLQATGCQLLRLDQSTGGVRLTTEDFQSLFLKTIGIPSLVPGVGGRVVTACRYDADGKVRCTI